MQPTPLERTTIKLLSLSLVPLEPRSTFSSYSSTSSASSSSSSSQISPHTTSFLSTPSPYTTHTRSSTSTIPQTPESISQRREKPKSLWRNPFLNNAGTKENAGNARGERDGKETAVLPSPPISPTTIVTARTATKVCREEIGIVRVGRGKMVRDRPHTHTHSAPFTLPLSSQDILFGEEQDLGFPFGHIVRSGESGMGRGRSLGSVGDQGTKLKDGDEEGEAKDLFALPSSPLLGDLEPHPGTLVDFFSGTRAANQTEPDGAKDGDAAEDSEQKIEMQERRHMLWEYHRFLLNHL
ncbi:hypothetical protein B0J11DRAFT_513258 [Dendryphion nanum]|uniref:Uncharacterized protein n=1 Tax=Dendryphion nanum TaxID=256645 RepID=A0A9P9EJ34_9PLEO|nr:hypothetical protein B0J11DRAFT_513258 [Dendryphion nanum]